MEQEQPRLTRMRAIGEYRLRLGFHGRRGELVADLAGFVARHPGFAPLRNDPRIFAKARIVDRGHGIAWPVETDLGRLDLSATTLRRIAEEQRPMTGADFAKWRAGTGLSLNETANVLGLSRRVIATYAKLEQVPVVLAIACRRLAQDETALAALHRPRRVGRAKSAA